MKINRYASSAITILLCAAILAGGCGAKQPSELAVESAQVQSAQADEMSIELTEPVKIPMSALPKAITSATAVPVLGAADVAATAVQSSVAEESDAHYLTETELAIIAGINEERKAKGLSEVRYNENLTKAARVRSEELCRTGHWDHTRPNGDSWSTVLQTDVPTSYLSAGENLATVSHNDPNAAYESDAAWWVSEWKNSPSHYENMMRTEFNEVGVGVYFIEDEEGQKKAYATTLFAQIDQ